MCACISAHVCVSAQACACMCGGGVNTPEAEKALVKAVVKEPLGFGLGGKDRGTDLRQDNMLFVDQESLDILKLECPNLP